MAFVSIGVALPQQKVQRDSTCQTCQPGGDWFYEDIKVSTPAGTADESFYDPARVTVTIPFRPVGQVIANGVILGRFKVVSTGGQSADFYDGGIFVMNLNPQTVNQFVQYMTNHWSGKLGWISDLKYAFYGGSYNASSACNRATVTTAFWFAVTIISAGEGSVAGVLAGWSSYYDAFGKEMSACGYH